MSPYNSRWDKQDDRHLDREVDRKALLFAIVVAGAAVLFGLALWGWKIAQGGSP